MKKLFAKVTSGRAIVLLALIALLSAASVVVVSGAGATSNASGPAGESAPAPGASGVVTSGPELSPADADTLARSFAASQADDSNPSSQVAVKGERAAAQAAVMRGSNLPESAPGALKSWYGSNVYVESLHGNFTLSTAPVPDGESVPTGHALTLIIDAHTGQVSSIALTENGPSRESLEHVGSVRQVSGE